MTNETKQTAVEWLESIFYSQSKSVGFDKFVILESEMDRIIEKAKEMEKEQIIDFASLFANSDSVYIEYDCDDCPAELTIESPDRLFELTYGGNI